MDVLRPSRVSAFLVLGGCAGSTAFDAEGFLRDLAQADAGVLGGVKQALGYDEHALYEALEDGEAVVFWDGALSGADLDGVVSAEGRCTYLRRDATFREVDWTLDLVLGGLDVGGASVDGALHLDVHENLFEASYEEYGGGGALERGTERLDVDHEALFAGGTALQRVTGRVNGVAVAWETDTPDVP